MITLTTAVPAGRLLALALILLPVAACGEATPIEQADAGPPLAAGGAPCQATLTPSSDATDPVVRLRLSSEDALELRAAAQVRVNLWATNWNVADVSATLVNCLQAPVDGVPLEVELPIPANAAQLIFEDSEWETEPEEVHYYVTFNLDADGDGQVCSGEDYREDYSRDDGPSGFNFGAFPQQTIERRLTVVDSGGCNALVPDTSAEDNGKPL